MDELRDFLKSRGKITLTLVMVNILSFLSWTLRETRKTGRICWNMELPTDR